MTHRHWRYFVSVIILCGLWTAVCTRTSWAAEDVQLEDVTVHGETTSSQTSVPVDLTAASTVIPMSDYQDRVVTIAEVLDQIPGVRVLQFGGLGDFATVSIRGSSGEQVQVYLDGIPLNQAAGGAVNLSNIPAALVESITVYRGQAPARYDSSAIGGVVDIQTYRTTKERRTELYNSFGSLTSYEVTALHSQTFGETGVLASYQYATSKGNFSYRDNNGTPGNPNDDQTVKRRNNQFGNHNFFLRISQPIAKDIDFKFYNNLFHEGRGVPGLGTLTSDTAKLTTTRNISQLEFQFKNLAPGQLQVRVNPFVSFNNSQFKDLNGEIGLGRQDNNDDTLLYGTRVATDFLIGTHQHLSFVVSYTGEQFFPENKLATPSKGAESIRNRVAVTGEDEVSLWNDRLLINPVFRVETIFNDLSGQDPSLPTPATANHSTDVGVSGKIGAEVVLVADLSAFGNFGRNFRVPSFLELFGDRGSIVGNPNLQPEESWNWDIGLKWHSPNYRFSGSYYELRTKNLIQFLQTSQFTAQARNLAAATIRGFEVEGYTTPFDWLELNGNYTFQWAKDNSGRTGFDGKFLPGRPRHQLHAGVQVHYHWARFFSDFDFISSNFLDSFNALKVSRRSLWGMGVGAEPWKWLQMSFEVKNLLNQQIEDVAGFPVPGRLFFGKVGFLI